MSAPSSGSGECRTCGGLALYQPVPDGPWWTHDDPSADHGVVIDPDTTSYGPHGVRLPSAESKSAALRRVEQERDEALAKLAKPCGECHPCEQYAPLQDAQKIADTNDLLRAELASARTELDAVRTARDNLDRELAAERERITAMQHGEAFDLESMAAYRAELEQIRAEADEKVRAVLAADHKPAAVVHAYDALYCRICYGRFMPDTAAADTHPHPLVPVRVSITHRTEEHHG